MTSGVGFATNRRVISSGISATSAAEARETMPLAVKQQRSMARTRENCRAPQL